MGPKQTVKQYLENWLENVRRLRIRSSTLQSYRDALHIRIIPALGHVQLNQLSREMVQTFLADLFDEGLSPNYIKALYMLLSSALKDAVDSEVLARNVCERVTLPRGEKYEARPLTKEECQRLITAARGHRLWFFILMGITTGARRGELTGLRWSDIDLAKGVVHIRRTIVRLRKLGFVANEPKTASGARKIRLTQIVIDGLEEQKRYIAAIRRHAGSAWKENDLLFPNKHGGYLDRWVISRQFQRVLEKAGLPYMRLHDLRHSAATLLLAAGVNVKVVQEMLGHSDIRITLQMYSHVMPDMQKDAADKMNDMFQ